ncbi:MAG TPA: hypothetical protein VJL29_11785 [Thermoguttaceae bacterium]|nr:hypothetical protein [Thermoguttaceae bacterium]
MNHADGGTSSSEPETAYAWRDADWLVLHEKKAVLPRRCVVCDAPAAERPLKMSLAKPVSVAGFLVFGWFAFICSQGCSARVWLCDAHRAEERRQQLILRFLATAGALLLGGGLFCVLFLSGKGGMIFFLCGIVSIMLSPCVFLITACFAMARQRLVDTVNIDKPFVWLGGVAPDYLARFPEVPREQQ